MKLSSRLLKAQLGDRVVIRLNDDGFQVNPDRTGTRELAPELEQAVLNALAFQPGARFPQVTDDTLLKSGSVFVFEGF